MKLSKRAIGFDLDYTLWDQDGFARSFYEVVAADLGLRLGLNPVDVSIAFNSALNRFTLYYPRLFDEALEDLGVWDSELVTELVNKYHAHRPAIRPYPDAESILSYLLQAGYRLFLVTDGHSEAQRYKVEALGIKGYFEKLIFTGDYSRENRKPSEFAFKLACQNMSLGPEECIYVGDNPQCDFEGPKRLGMLTISVSTGPFAFMEVPPHQTADLRISELNDLRNML